MMDTNTAVDMAAPELTVDGEEPPDTSSSTVPADAGEGPSSRLSLAGVSYAWYWQIMARRRR